LNLSGTNSQTEIKTNAIQAIGFFPLWREGARLRKDDRWEAIDAGGIFIDGIEFLVLVNFSWSIQDNTQILSLF